MRPTWVVRGFSLFMASLLAGCATYSPVLTKLNPSGPNVKKQTHGDLTIYIEEYATPEKSEKAFDTNLAAEGVLALLVSAENTGKDSYEIKPRDIVVREGDAAIKALTPEEAASKAKRSAVGRALGWSLIVPIISIPVAVAASAIHTNNVNDKIVQDFAAKGFPEGVVNANHQLAGFLYLEIPDDRKDLSGLKLDLTAKNLTTEEIVTITSALPSATFTAVAQATNNSDDADER